MKYRPSPITWLERHGVKLVTVGTDRYRCACPVHGGGPGSMGITKVDGTWLANCFACHFSGDALSLVMAIRSCSFPEALKELGCRPDTREAAPVTIHRRPGVVVVCDAKGCDSAIFAEGATYKIPGVAGGVWETTAEEEAIFLAELGGWWMGAEGVAAICPVHLP